MTFSIAARCPETGMLGGAVASSSPAVAARCLRARAGVGVALSQNVTDPHLGVQMLDKLSESISPETVLQALASETPFIDYRQLMLINPLDQPAVFNGAHTLGTFSHAVGKHAACAGNLLENTDVPTVMLAAFDSADGHLADRLLMAMKAGLSAGGEAGPIHSAGLLLVDKVDWPIVDLRVDWSEQPIEDLNKTWAIYRDQVDDYVTRALDPTIAPSYGVLGDL